MWGENVCVCILCVGACVCGSLSLLSPVSERVLHGVVCVAAVAS